MSILKSVIQNILDQDNKQAFISKVREESGLSEDDLDIVYSRGIRQARSKSDPVPWAKALVYSYVEENVDVNEMRLRHPPEDERDDDGSMGEPNPEWDEKYRNPEEMAGLAVRHDQTHSDVMDHSDHYRKQGDDDQADYWEYVASLVLQHERKSDDDDDDDDDDGDDVDLGRSRDDDMSRGARSDDGHGERHEENAASSQRSVGRKTRFAQHLAHKALQRGQTSKDLYRQARLADKLGEPNTDALFKAGELLAKGEDIWSSTMNPKKDVNEAGSTHRMNNLLDDDTEIEVEFKYYKGRSQTQTDPAEDAEIEIIAVLDKRGNDVLRKLNDRTIDRLENDIENDYDFSDDGRGDYERDLDMDEANEKTEKEEQLRIWDNKEKTWIGKTATEANKQRLRNRATKLDNEYGGYRYYVRKYPS